MPFFEATPPPQKIKRTEDALVEIPLLFGGWGHQGMMFGRFGIFPIHATHGSLVFFFNSFKEKGLDESLVIQVVPFLEW